MNDKEKAELAKMLYEADKKRADSSLTSEKAYYRGRYDALLDIDGIFGLDLNVLEFIGIPATKIISRINFLLMENCI